MEPEEAGQWEIIKSGSCALDSQQEAVHMCVIYNPNNNIWKVLYASGFTAEGSPLRIRSRILDLNSSPVSISSQEIPDWPAWTPPPEVPADWRGRIFCSGHVQLADGKILVGGGHRYPVLNNKWARGMPFTYLFNPEDETWEVATNVMTEDPAQMADGRWYPTLTTLGDGKVIAISGYRYMYDGNGDPVFNQSVEIYDPANPSWTELPEDAEVPNSRYVLYPGAHLIPYDNNDMKAGEIFYTVPATESWRFNPDGNGTPESYWNFVAESLQPRGHGCSVMLPISPNTTDAIIFILGGEDEGIPTSKVEMINLADEALAWNEKSSLKIPRKNANAVLLPDGKIFVVGGNQLDERETAVTVPELYDPNGNSGAGSSQLMAAQTYQRMYHSTAILLPDARVLSSGGEVTCDDIGSGNNNFEIYSPPYLFDAGRPVINNSEPVTEITYSNEFTLYTTEEITKIVLMRPGFPTHAFDQDQRAIELNFSQQQIGDTVILSINAPDNGNIAPPGYYMLFILKIGSSSDILVPSEAIFLKLS